MNARTSRRVAFVRFAPWMNFDHAHPHDLMWPIQMLYARSVAERQGYITSVLDLHVEALSADRIIDRIAPQRPDVVVMATMTPTARLAMQVAKRLKRLVPETQIWAVGQHATEQAERLVTADGPFDGALLGEYEASIGEMLMSAGRGPVSGSVRRTGDKIVRSGANREIVDPDRELPPLDPTPLLLDRYGMKSTHVPIFGHVRWGFLLTSWGCPYSCTFCSATLRQSYGRKFRMQSAEALVGDMLRLQRSAGIQAWYMIDDVFSLDRDRVMEICRLLEAHGGAAPWVIQTRPDLFDAEMLSALKRAGCVGVKMGIESGVDRILKIIKKGVRRQRIVEAAQQVRDSGLFLTAYYMIGHPTETIEEIQETLRFARNVNADMIQLGFHTPYPGSESYQKYGDSVIDEDELHHYETCHVNVSHVDGDTLMKLQRRFYLHYYLTPPFLLKYFRRRLPYRIADPAEWRLVWRTLRYLSKPAAAASDAVDFAARDRAVDGRRHQTA